MSRKDVLDFVDTVGYKKEKKYSEIKNKVGLDVLEESWSLCCRCVTNIILQKDSYQTERQMENIKRSTWSQVSSENRCEGNQSLERKNRWSEFQLKSFTSVTSGH